MFQLFTDTDTDILPKEAAETPQGTEETKAKTKADPKAAMAREVPRAMAPTAAEKPRAALSMRGGTTIPAGRRETENWKTFGSPAWRAPSP